MSVPSETVEISSNGDVILVCGEQFQDGQVKKLKVNSATLALGSPVMKTMFKPHFKEGTDLRLNGSSAPLEIALPEDDPLAMEIICHILHLCNDKVDTSKRFSAENILRVAMTSDKYNCRTAMMYPAQMWLNRKSTDERALHALFTAAYLFGNNEAFRKLGRDLILEMSSSALVAATEYAREHLQDALQTLDWKRREIQERVHAIIEQVIDARSTLRYNCKVSHTCVPGCAIAEICFAGFIQSLKQSKLFPLGAIKKTTVQGLVYNAMRVEHVLPQEALACASPDCIGRTDNLGNGSVPYITYAGLDMVNALAGPCLICFSADETDQLEGCKHFEAWPRTMREHWSPLDVVVRTAS